MARTADWHYPRSAATRRAADPRPERCSIGSDGSDRSDRTDAGPVAWIPPSIAACRAGARGTRDRSSRTTTSRGRCHRPARGIRRTRFASSWIEREVLTQRTSSRPGRSSGQFRCGIRTPSFGRNRSPCRGRQPGRSHRSDGTGGRWHHSQGHESGGRVGGDTAFVLIQKWRQHADVGESPCHFGCKGESARIPRRHVWLLECRASLSIPNSSWPANRHRRDSLQTHSQPRRQRDGHSRREARRGLPNPSARRAPPLKNSSRKKSGCLPPIPRRKSSAHGARRCEAACGRSKDGVWLSARISRAPRRLRPAARRSPVSCNICEWARHNLDAARRPGIFGQVAARPAARHRYPILQGPMTRVSDTAAFAEAVAANGALPFLALALLCARRNRETARGNEDELVARAVGRRHSRLRARRDPPRADWKPSAQFRRPSPSSPAAGPTRPASSKSEASPPICTSRRRGCCACS